MLILQDIVREDTKRMRGDKPAVFTYLRKSEGFEDVIVWIQRELLFEETETQSEV